MTELTLKSAASKRIVPVVERVFAGSFADYEARLSNLKTYGNARRFMVARMGSTGSAWFAKLLDSHPDVCCSHEGIVAQVFPAKHVSASDILRFIEYFAWDGKHDAYEVLGDVGSIWEHQLAFLPFTGALLVRHPARLLNTRLAIYPKDQSFTAIPPETRTCIQDIWGIDIALQSPIDQIFLNDLFVFAAQIRVFRQRAMVIRLEDLQDMSTCQQVLETLTGLDYSPILSKTRIEARVNRRSNGSNTVKDMLERFSPHQRQWYELMLGDIAPMFKYDLANG
jgi:hypothetical protein